MGKRLLCSLVVMMSLVTAPRPANAGCVGKFENCILAAAAKDTFWSAWWAYCDCELDLAECTRIAIIGN